nr:type IV conjugative transfer system protein TraE [Enterococcus sp. 665A]MBO1340268.1 hypothetical protein [Enterococcus sp. 665A]
MITRKISIEDIGYYGCRVTVFDKLKQSIDLSDRNQKRWFTAHYRIKGLQAERLQEHYVAKKKQVLVTETVSIKEIYPRIKHVNDADGVLIARRIAPNRPLLVTAKGMSKFLVMEQ